MNSRPSSLKFTVVPKTLAVVNGTLKDWVIYPATIGVYVGEESPSSEEDWNSINSAKIDMIGEITRVGECSGVV